MGQQLVVRTSYKWGRIKLKRFNVFNWLHKWEDMLDDAEMNEALKGFKQAEHIKDTFHARNRRI